MSLVGMYTSVGGRDVGHYRVLELIGHGGMGEVYKAVDTILGRTVALKVLPAWKRGSASAREGLIQEARYASALNHPNFVTVHEIAEVDGDLMNSDDVGMIEGGSVPGFLNESLAGA